MQWRTERGAQLNRSGITPWQTWDETKWELSRLDEEMKVPKYEADLLQGGIEKR